MSDRFARRRAAVAIVFTPWLPRPENICPRANLLWTGAGGSNSVPRMPPRAEPQPALGKAVRQLREAKGLTQEQVAHAADVHPTWVSRLEGGELNPSWGMVGRIAAGLGVSRTELSKAAEQFE